MTVQFIAEVSSNHNQDLDRSLRFVDAAADLGCQAVKFQLFEVEELFHPHVVDTDPDVRARKAWELPRPFLPEIADRCDERGIDFACSPFSLDAVTDLETYVDIYKIASYELLWNDLLEACAEMGKPVVVSTGMATLDEVEQAVTTLQDAGCPNPTVLHCVSAYPTPAEECNLQVIETLRERLDLPVGWSDHSVEPGVVHRAVHRFGADTVEFHLDLEDEAGFETDEGHCWTPSDIGPVIRAVRAGERADGDGTKAPADAERDERDWRADPSDGLRPTQAIREEWGD